MSPGLYAARRRLFVRTNNGPPTLPICWFSVHFGFFKGLPPPAFQAQCTSVLGDCGGGSQCKMGANEPPSERCPIRSFVNCRFPTIEVQLVPREHCGPTCHPPPSLSSPLTVRPSDMGVVKAVDCRQQVSAEVLNWVRGLKSQGPFTMDGGRRVTSWLLPVLFLFLGSLLWAHCDASPYSGGTHHASPGIEFLYDPYNTRGFTRGQPHYLPAQYYAHPAQPRDSVHVPQAHPVPPYPYQYGYMPPPPKEPEPTPRLPGAPEPYLTKAYDYTKDFLKSLESIRELKDPAVRTAMLALKELASTQPGSVFGDHEVKVCTPQLPVARSNKGNRVVYSALFSVFALVFS